MNRIVQGLLGHSNIQITERYVKFVGGHARKFTRTAWRFSLGRPCDFGEFQDLVRTVAGMVGTTPVDKTVPGWRRCIP
jgi:hypothetical protein